MSYFNNGLQEILPLIIKPLWYVNLRYCFQISANKPSMQMFCVMVIHFLELSQTLKYNVANLTAIERYF